MAEEIENQNSGAPETALAEEPLVDEPDFRARPGWREIFHQAFDRARRDERVMNRSELGRDRSRSLFLLAGAAIAMLLLFLGVFSSSDTTRKSADARRPVTPDLGRRVTPGLPAAGQPGSVTPLLNAQPGETENQGDQDVTSEDVDRTARAVQPFVTSQKSVATPVAGDAGPYALGKIDFSDAPTGEQASLSASSQTHQTSVDFGKPSLVFVRSSAASRSAGSLPAARADSRATLDLAAGTRLVARLESAVTSAIQAPVVAAIEYNYERDGEIVVPAGAAALGSLEQADRSGYVAIRFDRMQMPDGSTEKIDALAMSMTLGPLKGVVSGKRTGANFLVRAFTGLGQAATYLAGSGGLNAPLSQSALLRDRIATNVGIAGDQELNGLALNRNIVVTVPANTRLYLVVEKDATLREGEARPAAPEPVNDTTLPSAEDLRQLIELRRELGEAVQQPSLPGTAPQAPRQ